MSETTLSAEEPDVITLGNMFTAGYEEAEMILATIDAQATEIAALRGALEEMVEAHDYWFSTGKGESRAITATAKAKEILS